MEHGDVSLGIRSPTFRKDLSRSKRQMPFILGHSVIIMKESDPQPHSERERKKPKHSAN
jgi:hypothetical protein